MTKKQILLCLLCLFFLTGLLTLNAGDINKKLIDAINAKKDLATIKTLIKKGADINYIDDDFFTPLTYAMYSEYYQAAECLLDLDADVNADEGLAFILSFAKKQFALARKFIEKGANLESWWGETKTAVFEAVLNCGDDLSIVKYLVEKGADIHAKTDMGMSVLGYAIYADNLKALKYLVGLGLDINIKDCEGNGLLSYTENQEISDYLKSAGIK